MKKPCLSDYIDNIKMDITLEGDPVADIHKSHMPLASLAMLQDPLPYYLMCMKAVEIQEVAQKEIKCQQLGLK